MERTLRGRFAPSPSGRMHLGNLFTALLAWLSVRAAGGTMVLRMEDLDPDRCREEYAQVLADDLRWLGLDWDEGYQKGGPHGPYRQSERTAYYASGGAGAGLPLLLHPGRAAGRLRAPPGGRTGGVQRAVPHPLSGGAGGAGAHPPPGLAGSGIGGTNVFYRRTPGAV